MPQSGLVFFRTFCQGKKSLRKAVCLGQLTAAGHILLTRCVAALGTDHQVFRGVLTVDKLDKIDRITQILQNIGADRVGQQRGEPLFENAVLEQNIEIAALADGGVDLVLAAGDGKIYLAPCLTA